MLKTISILAILAASAGLSPEYAIKNMTVPEFDAAGHLIRRLHAESAIGALASPTLINGTIDLYDAKSDSNKISATLTFAQATYHRAEGFVDGDQSVHLVTARGKISGVGFRYEILTGHLLLRSAVSIDLSTSHITADRGEAILVQGASPISKAIVSGAVVVTGFSNAEYQYDRAETTSAEYTASDGIISLASPVTFWKSDKRSELDSPDIKIKVTEPPNQLPVPAATSGRGTS